MRSWVQWKARIKQALSRTRYAAFHARGRAPRDGLLTVHNDHFRLDPAFQEAYARGVKAGNGVDLHFEWRVHVALWAAAAGLRVPGDFVECGVNAGFMSSAIMQRLQWNSAGRRFYLIDTFAGPVFEQYSPQEIERGRLAVAKAAVNAGAYVTDLARVRLNFSEWPSAVVVPGSVPDVLSSLDIGAVAFLHIDMNCAYPERAALEFFWERLSLGALVLLDDYAYADYDAQMRAMDEAAQILGAQILSLPTGQGLIIKGAPSVTDQNG
jgi:hypothetical protein